MEPVNNHQSNLAPVSLDYDLISLSNTLMHSFEEGLRLAASMLNAPFFIANLYDYVVIRSEITEIDDPIWRSIGETRVCNSAAIAQSKNIYSVIIPRIGTMAFFSASEPTLRQRQLAPYIAWIVSSFGEEKFYVSDSTSTPQSSFLFYLVNDRLELAEHQLHNFLPDKLPEKMQVLVCFRKAPADNGTMEILKICNNTKYVTVYKQKYRVFLFSCLEPEQAESLSELLTRNHVYAGLSYPFGHFKMCRNHVLQAIAALNEAVKQGRKNYLASYEELFALDVLYNYSSDTPLSAFRHPVFLALETYDKNNDTEFCKTLMAYIENSGNAIETAAQLCMHRNTVLYRLRKIEEITGCKIQDSSRRASLLYAMTVEQTLKKLV